MNYAVIDLESTTLDNSKIITPEGNVKEIPTKVHVSTSPLSIGCVILNEDLSYVDEFYSTIKPYQGCKWDLDAEKKHKISREESSTFPNHSVVYSQFREFLFDYGSKFSFVCHAFPNWGRDALFDYQLVNWWFIHNTNPHTDYAIADRVFPLEKRYSTILTSKREAQDRFGVENQKLSSYLNLFNMSEDEYHNALYDAKVTAKVFRLHMKNKTAGMI